MGDCVIAIDYGTGKQLWSRPMDGDLVELGGHLASPPIAAGRSLLVATVKGIVLQLNPETGQTIKSYEIGSPIRFPPVVDQGRIYVGTQDGKLVCVDTGNVELTGWPMWGGDPGHTNISPTE
jgi:outer membrane protein assembly factor BamB